MTAIVAALLGLCSFAFYLHGLYPSVSVGDSGEFITAAWTLGVPHAPGFPTYTVLGHLFSDLMPFGNPAYRLNAFSAAAASSAVVLFFLALKRGGVRRSLAIGCAVVLMLSGALAANARASEVFSLNTLFLTGILYAAIHRQWLLAFFLTGLGAGNHQIMLFILPALVLSFWRDRDLADKNRQAAWGLIFLAGGLLVYGTLLCRAQKMPFLDVGHPSTLDRLWRVITRADYGSLTLALGQTPDRTLVNTILQLKRLGLGLVQQSSWPMILLALIGIFKGLRLSRQSFAFVGLVFLFLGPVFFVLGNLPFDAQSNGLLTRFLIAPTLVLLFFSAKGLDALSGKSRWVAGIVLLFGLGWQSARADWQGFRNDVIAYAYARNTLRTLPPSSTFIMDGGDDTFYTLAYLTQVESRRSDILMHDRGGVVFANPYGGDFRQLNHDDKEARRQVIEHALASAPRPLYYSTMNPQVLPGVALRQEGLLYMAGSRSASGKKELWPLYDFRGVAPWDVSAPAALRDYRTRALTPFYAYQQAIDLMNQGQPRLAWSFLKSALQTGPDVLWLIPNLVMTAHLCAYNAFNAHDAGLARDLYAWILTIHPDDATAQRNLQITKNQLHA